MRARVKKGGPTIRRTDPTIEPNKEMGRNDMWRHACDEIRSISVCHPNGTLRVGGGGRNIRTL